MKQVYFTEIELEDEFKGIFAMSYESEQDLRDQLFDFFNHHGPESWAEDLKALCPQVRNVNPQVKVFFTNDSIDFEITGTHNIN